uniref:Uncharacterized protein n=1 Tax=Panagrolaimus sp. JU765 TaxID=591449 RepID=A0AC34QK43_9BILA
MGANLGKTQSTYAYGFPPRRRCSNIENGNDFSKNYWGPNCPNDSSMSKIVGSEFWAIDSEERYRQEVFDRKSENFYPSASTFKNKNNFESPFSSSKKSKPLVDINCNHTSNTIVTRQPPPYTSGSILGQTKLRANPQKYIPSYVAGF